MKNRKNVEKKREIQLENWVFSSFPIKFSCFVKKKIVKNFLISLKKSVVPIDLFINNIVGTRVPTNINDKVITERVFNCFQLKKHGKIPYF